MADKTKVIVQSVGGGWESLLENTTITKEFDSDVTWLELLEEFLTTLTATGYVIDQELITDIMSAVREKHIKYCRSRGSNCT